MTGVTLHCLCRQDGHGAFSRYRSPMLTGMTGAHPSDGRDAPPSCCSTPSDCLHTVSRLSLFDCRSSPLGADLGADLTRGVTASGLLAGERILTLHMQCCHFCDKAQLQLSDRVESCRHSSMVRQQQARLSSNKCQTSVRHVPSDALGVLHVHASAWACSI